jgi:uncharacterized membrane protein YkvA (DUF1232 family)
MEWVRAIAFVGAGLVIAWLVLIAILWLNRPTRDLAAPAARLIPDLTALVRALLTDRATPRSVKIALAGLLVWLVCPIDLIPDFIPVIGPLDDLVLACLVLRWAGKRMGPAWIRRHWRGTPEGLTLLERLL